MTDSGKEISKASFGPDAGEQPQAKATRLRVAQVPAPSNLLMWLHPLLPFAMVQTGGLRSCQSVAIS